MSKPYYGPDGHRYNSNASTSNISLKPMLHDQAPLHSTGSSFNNDTYHPVASSNPVQDHDTNLLATADQRLKQRIRILKLVSRIIALVLSLATLSPLATTLTKFFETKDEVLVVNGQERTAWAKDSRAWYTYMYFGVASTSFLFDLAIVVAYCRGVKKANKAAAVATWWSTTVQVGHVVIWIASAAIYRYGKEPVGGKFRDLWGWTCSPAAQKIQEQVPNVNFDRYCTIQTSSWYTGLANVAAGVLSAAILLLALLRVRSKKRVNKQRSTGGHTNFEPVRS